MLENDLSETSLGIFYHLFDRLGCFLKAAKGEKDSGSKEEAIDVSNQLLRLLERGIKQKSGGVETDPNLVEGLVFFTRVDSIKKTLDDYGPEAEETVQVAVSILGCHLLRALLSFPKEVSGKLFGQLVSLTEQTFKMVCCDPVGGKEIIEPLLVSFSEQTIPEKALQNRHRVLLAKVLATSSGKQSSVDGSSAVGTALLTSLATNKFAWHILRKLFDVSDLKGKRRLVKEFANEQGKLSTSRYGMHLVKHSRLQLFQNSSAKWKQYWLNQQEASEQLNGGTMTDASRKVKRKKQIAAFLDGVEGKEDQSQRVKRKKAAV